jgi:hypothetical protein
MHLTFTVVLNFKKKLLFLKTVHPQKIYQHTKFHGPTLTSASLDAPQNFEIQPFGMVEATVLKGATLRSPSMALPPVLNIIKIY